MMNDDTLNLRHFLEKLPIKPETVEAALACFRPRLYRKNEFFALAGHVDNKLGFVNDGLFFMHIQTEDGVTFTKDFIRNGQFLLAAFVPAQGNLANIQALKKSIVLEAKYSDIQALFVRHPEFEAAAKTGMEKRIEAVYRRLESFALMEAGERYRLFKQTFGDIETEIPQYVIASYLGVTPTQLSRIRRNWADS